MKLLALVERDDHVCCRYRIAAFRSHLEAAGHTLTIQALPRAVHTRWRTLYSAAEADVVILQRRLLSQIEVALLRRRAKKLVFDFDDAIWLRDSHSRKGFHDPKRTRRFGAILSRADVLVAGNSMLADHVRRVSVEAHVAEIPTCIEMANYPTKSDIRQQDVLQLVWVGSSSTLKGLETQRELFESLGREIPGLRLKVICDRFPAFDHLPVDPVPWNQETEVAEIASADIGIGWVPDDPWSEGKCGLKLLQYHAAGLPIVANPVGVQGEIVRPGTTGYLATTTEEWVGAIRALAADAALRKRLGDAGREQVRSRYSTDVGGALWVELLAKLGAKC